MSFKDLDNYEKKNCKPYKENKNKDFYGNYDSNFNFNNLITKTMGLFCIIFAIALRLGEIALILFGLSLIFHFTVTLKLTIIIWFILILCKVIISKI